MSAQEDTLHTIAKHLALAIQPLKSAVTDATSFRSFLNEMGWDPTNLPGGYGALVTDVDQCINTLNGLSASPSIPDILNLVNTIKTIFENAKTPKPLPTGTQVAGLTTEFGESIFKLLLFKYLKTEFPQYLKLLELIGAVETVSHPSVAGRNSYKSKEFNATKLKDFINNPTTALKTLLQWGVAAFDYPFVIDKLRELLVANHIFCYLQELPDDYLYKNNQDQVWTPAKIDYKVLHIPLFEFVVLGQIVELGIALEPLFNDSVLGGPGFIIRVYIPSSLGTSVTINENFSLKFEAASNIASVFGILISSTGIAVRYPGAPNTPLPTAGFGATVLYRPPTPLVILGKTGASRLEMQGADLGFFLNYLGNSFEIELDAALKGFAIVLSGGDGDGFISKILGSGEKRIEVELGVNWSNTGGLRFVGAGGFELQLNPHIQLGPITIENLRLALQALPSSPAKVKVIAAAGLKLELGPFTAIVQEIGLELVTTFADGNAGPFDIKVGFKPPTGLGLSIKTETVTGAGFLSLDKEKGRYVGAFELSIKDKISIGVVGILTTKLPSGQPGYSLLILVKAEFQAIQLGFGFTLNGVGGLIALHRRMDTDVLRAGVRAGTLDHILFPKNIVENIDGIISTLETVFPIAEGRYSFGLMAKIGWGTPTLITAELGLFFELPNVKEIALIGIIRAILPKPDKEILKLQIAFAGIINFEKKFITFDASIFDSSIAGMPLSGDMVFRLNWGNQPAFVLSVGGFHPKFPIPPLKIPTDMRRLTVNLLDGDSPRLTLSTYFAITSNTAQFGAAIDFYWSITDKIDITGHLGYDALFYFSPFRFVATMEGSLEVRRNSEAIVSMWFAGLLEGPTPWHVQGSVGFKILGIEYEKDFDKTFGDHDTTTLPDVSVLPKLVTALQDKKNWQATLSNDVPLLVTIRELNTPGSDVVVHPQGTLAVSQKVVPLNLGIARFGNCRPDPSGFSYFSLNISYSSSASAASLTKKDLKEYFAPNEFFDLSETDRLYRPSFEQFTAGAEVTSTSKALKTGGYREMEYVYETTMMDSRRNPVRMPSTRITYTEKTNFSGGNATANSPLAVSQKVRSEDAPLQVEENGQSYAIAQTSNLNQYGTLSAKTHTEALALLERELELNPALEGTLQIVNTFELN